MTPFLTLTLTLTPTYSFWGGGVLCEFWNVLENWVEGARYIWPLNGPFPNPYLNPNPNPNPDNLPDPIF